VTEPTAPTKTGHSFAGWFTESDLTNEWDFATDVVTDNTTLYAKWTPNSYTVSFNSNGGSAVADQVIGINGKATEPIAPTKAGHTFAGWFKDLAFTDEWNFDTVVVMENTTLYAKWTPNPYTLTFESNGGSSISDQVILFNEKASLPASPTKSGHSFAGWFKESALTNEWDFTSDVVVDNTTLYAKWVTNSYILNFDSNGGSSVPDQLIEIRGKVTLPNAPTKADHTFVGWFKESTLTNEWDFATDVVIDNTTLYAKWDANLPSCTASFTDTSSHWAKVQIEDIANRCIILGYLDGTFRPNESIKRSQVAVMFTRAFELTPIRSSHTFNDVPKNHLFYDAINQVYQSGIFDGLSTDKFSPDANMTRAQMAKVLVLAFELNSSGDSTFHDVPSTHWAYDYISTLAEYGIVLGDNGYFKPDELVTRAEFVAFMYRALEA